MAARRIQDWTNKNIFVNSFDYSNFESYQNATFSSTNIQKNSSSIPIEKGLSFELKECSSIIHPTGILNEPPDNEKVVDPHSIGSKSITALQAAWNVTNAIQGMFIVGLPFAVKVQFFGKGRKKS